jgi:hypothetical protein
MGIHFQFLQFILDAAVIRKILSKECLKWTGIQNLKYAKYSSKTSVKNAVSSVWIWREE